MKKYNSKKEVLEKWQNKIDNIKHYYNIGKKSGEFDVGFYNSEIYKNLDKKRKRAIYRYENREIISEQRKQRREKQKEIDRYFVENEPEIDSTFSGNFLDAFKGRRGTVDRDLAIAIKHENFEGFLSVIDGNSGLIIYENKFFSIPGYFKEISYWINKIFIGEKDIDSGALLNNEVEKKHFYNKETKTLYYSTKITIYNE